MIQNRDVKLVNADAKHAQLEIHNDWLLENKKMAEETDEVTVAERDGVYVIDLAYRLTPVVDYVFLSNRSGASLYKPRNMVTGITPPPTAKSLFPPPPIPILIQTGRPNRGMTTPFASKAMEKQ